MTYAATLGNKRIHALKTAGDTSGARRLALQYAVAHRFLARAIRDGLLVSVIPAQVEAEFSLAYLRIARSLRRPA